MIASNKNKEKKPTSKKATRETSRPVKSGAATSKSIVRDAKKSASKAKPAASVSKTVKLDRGKAEPPKSKKAGLTKPVKIAAVASKSAKNQPKPAANAKPVKSVGKSVTTKPVAELKPSKTMVAAAKNKSLVKTPPAKPIAAKPIAPQPQPPKPANSRPTLPDKSSKSSINAVGKNHVNAGPTKIKALPKVAEPVAKPKKVDPPAPPPSLTKPSIVKKIRGLQHDREIRKDLAQPPTSKAVLIPHARPEDQPRDPNKDRLILMVRDPFWLHAFWDITRKSVERAKAALAGHWHTAHPVLRLLRTDDNSTTSNSEIVYKDIEIHGGVRHWYIEIESPGSTFRLLIGFLYANNRFHELARSNPVTPPIPGGPDSTDDHWADLSKDADRVYALSGGNEDGGAVELQQMMQEKLKKPVGNPSLTQFGSGAEGSLRRMKNFHLELDAEMVVYGNTHPSALLTVGSDPVPVRSDGSYSTRVPLPNSRQVLTVTSKSRDGLDEQTVVIAVERNTKVMEPLSSSEPDE